MTVKEVDVDTSVLVDAVTLDPVPPRPPRGFRNAVFATLSDRLPRRSRRCAARAGCPTPTSTPPPARSGSRCSRPTSRSRSSRTSSPRSRSGPAARRSPQALNPAQQVIKIVNDELVRILGGETRRLRFAKQPPTVIMLAGLQGSGKTTLAGKLAALAEGARASAAARRGRPAAPERGDAAAGRRRAGRRRGVGAGAGQRRRRPGRRRAVRRRAGTAEAATTSWSSTPPAGSASTPR